MANVSAAYSDSNASLHNDVAYLSAYNDEIMRLHLPAIIYTAAMMVVGLPGNMIVFYVYLCRWRRSTSRMFILFLAALDTVNCVTTLPMEIFIMRYPVIMDLQFICKLSRFSTFTMNSSSALVLVGIAADRFTRICRPYRKTFSADKSRYICIGAIVTAVCATWPAFVLYGTRKVDLGQATGSSCSIQNHLDDTMYPMVFFGVMATLTFAIFTALAVLYTFVGIQIYQHRNFKLKNCTHVQQVVDEKSTEKSQSVKQSNDKGSKQSNDRGSKECSDRDSKHSSNDIGSTQPNMNDSNGIKDSPVNGIYVHNANGIDITKDEREGQTYLQKRYRLELVEHSQDAGTSCGLLNIPNHSYQDVSTDRSIGELSTKTIDIDEPSRIELDETVQQSCEDNTPPITAPTTVVSPHRRPKSKRRRTRVRYLLVRGSSTLTASGGTRCVNCLTVRIGRSTLMLFLITIAYVLSFLPFYTMAIVRQSNTSFVQNLSSAGYMAYHVFLRSYLLSSAINPIIYSFCNVQFREYCLDTFWRLFHRNSDNFHQKSKLRGHMR